MTQPDLYERYGGDQQRRLRERRHDRLLVEHAGYERVLDDLQTFGKSQGAAVSQSVLVDVLYRVMVKAPDDVPRADLARGEMLVRPKVLNAGMVSKAVAALVHEGLLCEKPAEADPNRAGRPVKPLRLGGSRWGLMGITVDHAAGRPVALSGVITGLDGEVLVPGREPATVLLPGETTLREVPKHIGRLAESLQRDLRKRDKRHHIAKERKLLGVGVQVAGHVHDGDILEATLVGVEGTEPVDLAGPLYKLLNVPVVVDNDVNILATLDTYRPRYPELNVAHVAVFEDGVGAGLILNGHVYRGGNGMAGEPGHALVRPSPSFQSSVQRSIQDPDLVSERRQLGRLGFDDPCYCGRHQHVDCYATPARIRAELDTNDFDGAADRDACDAAGNVTDAGAVFQEGGRALGQGLATIVNIVNPSRIVLHLPPALTAPRTGSAAAAYRQGAEDALGELSFSTGARDARAGADQLTVEGWGEPVLANAGRRAGYSGGNSAWPAAIRVLDDFLLHARGRDACSDRTI